MLGSEYMTAMFDLKTYVFHAPRSDFISANKEGLISLFGYLAISCIGIGIGSDIYKTLVFEEPAKYAKIIKTKKGIEEG